MRAFDRPWDEITGPSECPLWEINDSLRKTRFFRLNGPLATARFDGLFLSSVSLLLSCEFEHPIRVLMSHRVPIRVTRARRTPVGSVEYPATFCFVQDPYRVSPPRIHSQVPDDELGEYTSISPSLYSLATGHRDSRGWLVGGSKEDLG